jgi:protein arginine kinase activator
MKCQDCGEREGIVNITQIINNEKTVLHLCRECADQRGFHSPLDSNSFPLANFLSGMLAKAESMKSIKKPAGPSLTCPNCGLTLDEFSQQGRLGCGRCYETFRNQLQDILRKIHGSSLHRGKLPPTLSEEGAHIKEQERLQEELRRAIESEDFERAAELRDKIKSLEEEDATPVSGEKKNV